MPLVASKDLAIAIDDYYEVAGIRYTVKALNPRSFISGKVPAIALVTKVASNFSEEGKDLTAGESIDQGETRAYTVAGVSFTLENRVSGTRTVADPIDVAELDKWFVTSQYPSPGLTFPASLLIPKGYRLRHTDGAILINKTTRTTGTTIDLTKWDTEVESLSRLNNWIADAGDDYAEGDKLLKADDRRINVGGVGVRITYRGADKLAVALDAAELANWEYVGQSYTPILYPGAVLAPKGFRYKNAATGQTLQLKADRLLPAQFDASQWEPTSDPGIRHNQIPSFRDVLGFAEKAGVFFQQTIADGPENSAVNCSGNWHKAENGANGILTATFTQGDFISLINGTWTIRWATTTTNGVATTTWGNWTRYDPSPTAWADSVNGMTAPTGSYITLLDGHSVNPTLQVQGPLYLRPKTAWANVPNPIAQGTDPNVPTPTVSGYYPEWGSTPITVTFVPGDGSWRVDFDKSIKQSVSYTANGRIPSQTISTLRDGALAMTLSTPAVGKIIYVCWLGNSTTALPVISLPTAALPANQLKFFAPWITTAPTTLDFKAEDRGKWITLIGRADGWDVTIGGAA